MSKYHSTLSREGIDTRSDITRLPPLTPQSVSPAADGRLKTQSSTKSTGPKLIGSQGLVQDTQPCPHTHRPKGGHTSTHTHTHVRQAHTSQNAPSCADSSDILTPSVRHQWRLIQFTHHCPPSNAFGLTDPCSLRQRLAGCAGRGRALATGARQLCRSTPSTLRCDLHRKMRECENM